MNLWASNRPNKKSKHTECGKDCVVQNFFLWRRRNWGIRYSEVNCCEFTENTAPILALFFDLAAYFWEEWKWFKVCATVHDWFSCSQLSAAREKAALCSVTDSCHVHRRLDGTAHRVDSIAAIKWPPIHAKSHITHCSRSFICQSVPFGPFNLIIKSRW